MPVPNEMWNESESYNEHICSVREENVSVGEKLKMVGLDGT